MDKSSWSPGPWHDEPDVWHGEASGYVCSIRRVPHSGHLCGYVTIPLSHPWYGLDYSDDAPTPPGLLESPVNIDKIGVLNLFCAPAPGSTIRLALCLPVHGGLTYAEAEDEDWTFGFDCAHAGDATPGHRPSGTYRTFAYVREEVESLARQLRHFHSVADALAGV